MHYRGHPNRGLRGLRFDAAEPAGAGADVVASGKPVGRVTSAVASPRLGAIALAVVRREVPDGETVDAGGLAARVSGLPFRVPMP
jgi:glycine cleavage system aminomethyltransferase T